MFKGYRTNIALRLSFFFERNDNFIHFKLSKPYSQNSLPLLENCELVRANRFAVLLQTGFVQIPVEFAEVSVS